MAMLENKKFIILFLLLVIGLSIGFVSANQHNNAYGDNVLLKPLQDTNESLQSWSSSSSLQIYLNHKDAIFPGEHCSVLGNVDYLPCSMEYDYVKVYIDGNYYDDFQMRSYNTLGVLPDIISWFDNTCYGGFDIPKLTPGNHTLLFKYDGYDEPFWLPDIEPCSASCQITILQDCAIKSKDIEVVSGDGSDFSVKVIDKYDNSPIENTPTAFKIDGLTYDGVTDSEGNASLKLPRLSPGTHNMTTTCLGKSVTNKITVYEHDFVIESHDVTENYGSPFWFKARIVDNHGNPKPFEDVSFSVDRGTYYTNDEGYANIYLSNLSPGEHDITTTFKGVSVTNKITILNNTNIESSNMTKEYYEDGNFTVRILDVHKVPLPNANVSFTINGETYSAISNDDGYASFKLPIDLLPGDYIVNTSFNDASVTNKITISSHKSVIQSSDMTKYYGDEDNYTVRLVDSKLNPITDEYVLFMIDGQVYDVRQPDSEGYINLDLLNLSPSEHTIKIICSFAENTNVITILEHPNTIENSNMTKYDADGSNFTVGIVGDRVNSIL
ncbi:MAG: Ig-like domain-containing protein [archaeon]|nr:Ig-like domain-containing protein [archaeon]